MLSRISALRPVRLAVALTLAAGLLLLFAVPASADERVDIATVDRWIWDYLRAEGLPGAAVAVVHDGQIVVETGQSTNGDPITATTPMSIGSVSKMITAFAVLQLVDQRKVDLDRSVTSQLPEFTLDDPRGAEITVRQLLEHTSGLPNPLVIAAAADPAQRVSQVRTISLDNDPGTTYAYSNLNYQTAARLVETVSGQDFATYLDEHIFTPLGMADTRSVLTTPNEVGLDDGHVTAYGGAWRLREMTAMYIGSGSVISTAHDMALWLAMQQRGGVTADGTRLLSQELITQARSPRDGSTYALGWQATTTSTPPRIGHDGALTRYSARAELVPSSGYGVVVLLNSYTPITKHPFEISAGVVALTEGRAPSSGAPVATIVDAILGVLTLAVVALAVVGLRRAPRWVERRSNRSTWSFGLRLVPQLLAPAVAIYVFAVLPALDNNSATPVDALGLFPALMILLAISAVGGILVTATRLVLRQQGAALNLSAERQSSS
ncbi:serine hydrolase domain-containing protein [Microlunatus capsulatus]|uniref:CubicO group peptidase (Beta-lactamase class C family) n=1 Tax=Microlunatus capsulatus TaxID=99117 RepID=A0ABS4ZBS0_9ACTN|nr:serine hydrolase domain-containing protein [Microlunatus capsulatus]MBP2417628.1 CubicO group peptidase (beta-lactamase class C family) [Microlunatus capsulatus]